MSAKDIHGKTAIEYVFEERNIDVIEALSYDFSASCIEKLACINEGEGDTEPSSLLMQWEGENMEHCEKLGIIPAVVEEVKEEAPPRNDDDDEGDLDLDLQMDEGGLTEEKADEHPASSLPLEEQPLTDSDQDPPETSGTVLTDPAEIAAMQTRLEQSNALLTLVLGLLQEANIVAKDGHVHECFFEGQLYADFCKESNARKMACDEEL